MRETQGLIRHWGKAAQRRWKRETRSLPHLQCFHHVKIVRTLPSWSSWSALFSPRFTKSISLKSTYSIGICTGSLEMALWASSRAVFASFLCLDIWLLPKALTNLGGEKGSRFRYHMLGYSYRDNANTFWMSIVYSPSATRASEQEAQCPTPHQQTPIPGKYHKKIAGAKLKC